VIRKDQGNSYRLICISHNCIVSNLWNDQFRFWTSNCT